MTRRTTQLLAFLLVSTTAAAAQAPLPGQQPAYRVLVNPGNPTASVSRSVLAGIFLKKVTRWEDGTAIRPADLARGSALRRRFVADVLGRSLAAVQSYWQQQIFSGRDLPPPELESDAAVVSYVLKHPGAIGYVSASAVPSTAKVLIVK